MTRNCSNLRNAFSPPETYTPADLAKVETHFRAQGLTEAYNNGIIRVYHSPDKKAEARAILAELGGTPNVSGNLRLVQPIPFYTTIGDWARFLDCLDLQRAKELEFQVKQQAVASTKNPVLRGIKKLMLSSMFK